MTSERIPSLRRPFQYWSVVVLSILIPSAALLGESSDVNVPMNATLLSLVLLASTVFELAHLHWWQDTSELLCAFWLIGSPFIFGYAEAGQLRYWHIVLGALLAGIAIFNLWEEGKPHRKA